ncbi:MAG: DUF1028 domain-containing protein, partial [Pseudomonadota bacterium]
MTFSITARCDRTGMFGVAITTSSIAVGSRCPWVRAGVGAVATQNVTLPSIGGDVLDLLEGGTAPQTALDQVLGPDAHPSYRQVAVVSAKDQALFSGSESLGIHTHAQGHGCIAAGNLLATDRVPSAMISSFEGNAEAHLAERLLRALEVGLGAGGEAGPVKSAALLVADTHPWPLVDLRVDWADEPVAQLRALWTDYLPQMDDYV